MTCPRCGSKNVRYTEQGQSELLMDHDEGIYRDDASYAVQCQACGHYFTWSVNDERREAGLPPTPRKTSQPSVAPPSMRTEQRRPADAKSKPGDSLFRRLCGLFYQGFCKRPWR